MIRTTKHLISHRPYAVNLDTLTVAPSGHPGYWHCTLDGVWFRRGRHGRIGAVYGHLWDGFTDPPVDAADFLARHTDGRYGGQAMARWDGATLWTDRIPHANTAVLWDLLNAALTGYPNVPEGHDGWWEYER